MFGCTAALVFTGGLFIVAWQGGTSPNPGKPISPDSQPTGTEESPAQIVEYARRLTNAGWNQNSAESVVELNKEWFTILADENPGGLELQMKLLEGLGGRPALSRFLSEHPETAGLLAVAEDPEGLASLLDSARNDYATIAGLYVQHVGAVGVADLSEALKENSDLICQLQARGLPGCELLFIFDRNAEGAEEYEHWLREALQAKFAASDAEFASFINLVMRQGPALREKLSRSESFRTRFRTELWPRLVRVVDGGHGTFELYLDEDSIWEMLALDNGEELLKRCGLLPLDLLFGHPEIDHKAYPEHLHARIVQILLRREEQAIHALMKFRGEPSFEEFLGRDLPAEVFSASLTQLFRAGPNYPETLKLFARLSDKALIEETGPPPSGLVTWIPLYYTVYEIPRKLAQGRQPTSMDLFSAAVDPLFLAVDIFSGGSFPAGRRILIAGGKEAADAASRKLVQKGWQKVIVTTLRDSGLELASKQLGKDIAAKMGEKELVSWSITAALSEIQHCVRTAIGKATVFEITKPVQFMFQYSRAGRQTWKRFTGMEARLFMRGDAKVYVRLTNTAGAVLGSRGAAFFERTAQDLALGAAFESELGQDVIQEGLKTGVSAADQLRAWQQNVSAWWLLNASRTAIARQAKIISHEGYSL